MQGLQAHVAVSKHILATDREIEEEILPITMPPASDVRRRSIPPCYATTLLTAPYASTLHA